jgi:hypothetical protein
MMRRMVVGVVVAAIALSGAGTAWACAGSVTPGGNVRLLRTVTLAAWAGGVEHYVTSFRFEGGGAEFGSIVPLPGIPTSVERGGDWTLQRLDREVAPPVAFAASSASGGVAAGSAQVVLEKRIDALDITVLRGGGAAVGRWARQHGFQLTPDAPAILDFYAARSRIFLAARFNAQAARDRGQVVGDGTPIHLTIPLAQPWVPLRILGLGLGRDGQIGADVFLLTPKRPALLPAPREDGFFLARSEPASTALLDDLRSDKGMGWMPTSMWLSYLQIDESALRLRHDLAIDPLRWWARPSAVAAGLARPAPPRPPAPAPTTTVPLPPTTSRVEGADALAAPAWSPAAATSTGSRALRTESAGLAMLLLITMMAAALRVHRRALR